MTPEYLAKHTQLTNQELIGIVEAFAALAPSDEASAELEKLRAIKFDARRPAESSLLERKAIIAVLNAILLTLSQARLADAITAAEAEVTADEIARANAAKPADEADPGQTADLSEPDPDDPPAKPAAKKKVAKTA